MERRGFFGRLLGGLALAAGVKPGAAVTAVGIECPTEQTYARLLEVYHDRLWFSSRGGVYIFTGETTDALDR